MTVYARSFETQGNFEFAELFGQVFPAGADSTKINRFIDYRRAVEARLYTFSLNERFQIECCCGSCKRHSFIPVWDIAVALQAQSVVGCSCGDGSLLPIFKENRT